MPVSLRPNSEIVTIAWILSIESLQADVVATQLPADNTQWAAYGAILAQVVGGIPDMDVPIARPVMQLDFVAVTPGSNKPPWFKANALAEQVRAACHDRPRVARMVTPYAGGQQYPAAKVLGAYLLTEPRRSYGDPGALARYTADLAIDWAPAATSP